MMSTRAAIIAPRRAFSVPPLAKFIIRRVLLGSIIMLAASTLVFFATVILPGDAAVAKLGRDTSPAALEAFRTHFQLDDPLISRYLTWLGNLFQGDMGVSLASSEPVTSVIGAQLGNSLALVVISSLIGIPIALALGIYAAVRKDGLYDHGSSVALLAFAALPEFVVGITLVLLFSTKVFQAFPATSLLDPNTSIWSQLDFVWLPAITLALLIIPYIARMIRASMVEILESDYVAMARLKGLHERRVIVRHAFVNAAPPTLQVIALVLSYLFGGVVVVEMVFQFPGIGLLLINSVGFRDIAVIQGLVIFIALAYTVVTITADVLTTIMTPRLRTQLK